MESYEFKSINHFLGLIALGFNLLAMAMKNIVILRILSATGNFFYIIYGLLIDSPPLMIGGIIIIIFHCYHIHKLRLNNKLRCD